MAKYIAVLVAVLVSVMSITGVGFTLDQEQRDLYEAGIYYYDIEESSLGSSLQCSSGSFIGSENIEIAFNYFRSIGLTDNQAAGIVGNLIKESAVMPNRKQGNGIQTISSPDEITPGLGYGIAQWTTADRQQDWLQFAEDNNQDPLSLELQLEFLLSELEGDDFYGYEELREAESLRQASWIFLAFFERPGVVVDAGKAGDATQPSGGSASVELDERERYAAGVFDEYSGSAIPVEGGGCRLVFDTSEPATFSAIPSIQLDGSPPGAHTESNCTGGFTVGAASLSEYILDNFSPPVTSVGGYHCRSIVGGSRTSIHGLGRALDIMVLANTPRGLETGNNIRNLLYNNAEQLGIQRIIWNRSIWSSDKDGWRTYTGQNAHTDHLHVEINIEASNNASLAGGF